MKRKGFTLIELLLVIGIIAILASIVIVAINPQRQLASARDAQRQSDVNTLLNAIYQYIIDEETLPACISGSYTETEVLGICPDTCTVAYSSGDDTTDGSCALKAILVDGDPSYMGALPQDPQIGNLGGSPAEYTGYTMSMENDRITIQAPGAEDGTIESTR